MLNMEYIYGVLFWYLDPTSMAILIAIKTKVIEHAKDREQQTYQVREIYQNINMQIS